MRHYNSRFAKNVKSQIANGSVDKERRLFGSMSRRADKLSTDPVARRLALTRMALGFDSQKEFASGAGIEPNTYNPWETGARRIPFNQAEALCRKYGLVTEWFYEGVADRLQHKLVKKLIELGAIAEPTAEK